MFWPAGRQAAHCLRQHAGGDGAAIEMLANFGVRAARFGTHNVRFWLQQTTREACDIYDKSDQSEPLGKFKTFICLTQEHEFQIKMFTVANL